CTMRLREPFFSVFTTLNDQFSLDQFVTLTIKSGFGYQEMEETEVRKIVYRQIVRMCSTNAIKQISEFKKHNPTFQKTPDQETVTTLSGCSILPMFSSPQPSLIEEEVQAHHKKDPISQATAQIERLQSKKNELIGEFEGYEMLAQLIPEFSKAAQEEKLKTNLKQAKVEGMLNAFTKALSSLEKGLHTQYNHK
ncbi:hypothetical protein, partial [Vibrio paucivorans]